MSYVPFLVWGLGQKGFPHWVGVCLCALSSLGSVALTRRLFCVHLQGRPRFDAGTDEGR